MPREMVLRPKGKLTAAWLDRLKIEEGGQLFEGRELIAEDVARVTVKDTDVRGLELRISSTGARSWAVSRRVSGVQRRFTIPNGAGLTLAEARKRAEALRTDVEGGRDPTEERRQARKGARMARLGFGRAWTIEALVDDYGAKVAMPAGQRSWEERRAHVLREFRSLADLPIEEIEKQHVLQVLDAAVARGAKVAGWHAYRYLRTILTWAAGRDLIARNPLDRIDLKATRSTMMEGKRDRVLEAKEIARLWPVLEADAGNVYSAVLRVAALTAQRINEVTTMKWADIDLGSAMWSQSVNKSDRPHLVPLSAAAVEIIRAQPERRGVPYVFTTMAGGPLNRRTSNIYRSTTVWSERSGVTGWRPHDWRRTAATILAKAKVPPVVVEQLLNHSPGAGKGSAVASIYNRHSYDWRSARPSRSSPKSYRR